MEMKIDFKELEKIIKERYGIKDFELIISSKENGGYEIKSNQLIEEVGLFKNVFSSCVIENYNDDVYTDLNGEKHYWTSIHIRYNFSSGGSNGLTLFDADYTDKKGWVIK